MEVGKSIEMCNECVVRLAEKQTHEGVEGGLNVKERREGEREEKYPCSAKHCTALNV
jgi:hypothetical protein